MKISKSLTQAIAVGLTMGVATSSCSIIEPLTNKDEHKCEQSCEVQCTEAAKDTFENCPACEMG